MTNPRARPVPLASLVLAALLAAAHPRAAAAQWAVTAEFGAARFWGGTGADDRSARSFRPYRPTTVAVGVERRAGTVGVGIRALYFGAALAIEDAGGLAAAKGAIEVLGLAPEVAVRLGRTAGGAELWLSGGPLVEWWELADEMTRTRLGARAGVGLDVPLTGPLSAAFRAGAAVTPASPFTQEDLTEGFEPRALWRREVGASLRYRW